MTDITDAEAAEVLWASSEQGKAAVMAAWEKAKALQVADPGTGRFKEGADMADIGAIVYAAYQAAGWDSADKNTGPEPFRDMESFVRWLDANGVSTSLPYGSRGIDPARLMTGITTLVTTAVRLAAQR